MVDCGREHVDEFRGITSMEHREMKSDEMDDLAEQSMMTEREQALTHRHVMSTAFELGDLTASSCSVCGMVCFHQSNSENEVQEWVDDHAWDSLEDVRRRDGQI